MEKHDRQTFYLRLASFNVLLPEWLLVVRGHFTIVRSTRGLNPMDARRLWRGAFTTGGDWATFNELRSTMSQGRVKPSLNRHAAGDAHE